MSTFAEKKAAAKTVARKFKDVVVSLDAGLSGERDDLMRQLVAEQERAAERLAQKPNTAAIEAKLEEINAKERDTLTTVRLYSLAPLEWVGLQSTSGFNLTATCLASLPEHARVLDGDTELAQTAEEWSELFELTSAPDVTAVLNAVYELNVNEPAERLARVKNSSEAATASAKK